MQSALIGYIAGIMSGMGIGGGTVLIALMTLIVGLTQLEAQATNLIAYIPAVIIALFIHRKDHRIETKLVKPICVGAMLGMLAGVILAININMEWLRKGFAVFMIGFGIWQWVLGEKGHREQKNKKKTSKPFGE